MSNGRRLTNEEINRLYGALRSRLNGLSVQNIRNTAAAAGIDVTQIPSTSEARTGLGSRAEVMPVIDRLFRELSQEAKVTALRILAEELRRPGGEAEETVDEILGRHGFVFVNGRFVPVDLLDARERQFLPPSSSAELARAMSRLVDGDESGAITSACGAVDKVTKEIYRSLGIGDPRRVAYQAKVNTVIKHLLIFDNMCSDLIDAGLSEDDANTVVDNIRSATNGAAQALQVLRRTMGDVHGSELALRKTAYDCIKWSAAICGLLEGWNRLDLG